LKFIIVILVVLLGCTIAAYQGIQPLAASKDKITNWVETQTSKITEPKVSSTTATSKATKTTEKIILKEYFLAGSQIFPSVIQLNKIQQWLYSSSKQLDFKSLNPPYVVNVAIRTQTSKVATDLTVRVYKKGDPYKVSDFSITTQTISGMGGRQGFIIKEKGDYIIDVQSVGCEWWAMVGHETEAYRQ
jgi:hypothetical protein